ncbi:MAG TPA: hypothetical protein VG276_28880 [Actinomycetes bacterium]|jgi:hypothetical protein|nr:hypothetical protein [Actinomycetes bacterium]
MTAEIRGNWETRDRAGATGTTILAWPTVPEERNCPLCRRNVLHTRAEHDLVYGPAKQERDRIRRQLDAAQQLVFEDALAALIGQGWTAEKAFDELVALESHVGFDRVEAIADGEPHPWERRFI